MTTVQWRGALLRIRRAVSGLGGRRTAGGGAARAGRRLTARLGVVQLDDRTLPSVTAADPGDFPTSPPAADEVRASQDQPAAEQSVATAAASSARRREALAFHWAPIHYQDTDDSDARADYISAVNYDRDWRT